MKNFIKLFTVGTIGYLMGYYGMKYRLMKCVIETHIINKDEDEDESK